MNNNQSILTTPTGNFYESIPVHESITVIKQIKADAKKRWEKETQVSSEVISRVRSAVLEMIDKKPDEFNAKDGARVAKHDFWITRFVPKNSQKSDDYLVKEGISKLEKCLKWRHQFGVSDIKVSDFPAFMFKLNRMAKDADGNIYHFMRGTDVRKCEELYEIQCKFTVFLMEELDLFVEMTGGDRMSYLAFSDLTGMGLINLELRMWLFRTNLINDYYTYFDDNPCFLYEMPFLARAIFKVAIAMGTDDMKKRIIVTNKTEATDKLGLANIPIEVGGGVKTYTPVPQEALTFDQFISKYNLSDKVVDKIKNIYSDVV